MKILFIASRFPYPPYKGDSVRAFRHLSSLAQKHEITLVSPPPEYDEYDSLKPVRELCLHMEIIPSPRWKRYARLCNAPLSVLPLQTLYFFDAQITNTVKKLIAAHSYDIAHVQLIRMAPVVQALGSVPTVLDLIDSLSLNMARRAKRERGLKRRLFAVEAVRTQRYERALTDLYDRLIVCSSIDRETIGDFDNLHVIPNVIDLSAHPFHFSDHDPETIIFTGRMAYHPNVEGAIWFATEILPLIRKEMPKAKFQIVGADPTPAIQRLGQLEGVTVTGRVPELQEYLGRATVAVAPLRSGSGMQNKVIEAMAAGTPVVATSYALGGIDADWDPNLLVADNAAGFAEQVVRLLRNPGLARRIAQNAREMVESRYTEQRSLAMLEEIYDMAAGRKAAAAVEEQAVPVAERRAA